VLVTRASEQSAALVNLLQNEGFATLRLPCIEIHYQQPEKAFTPADFDVVIFTSYHAVQGMRLLEPFPWKGSKPKLMAIGPATADQLTGQNQTLVEAPSFPFNSEALLTTATLKAGHGRSVAIVKGVGGRELLEQTLRNRGFAVMCVDTYERTLPEVNNDKLAAVFLNSPADIVTITSNEILQNLIRLAGDSYREYLFKLPLAVGSLRAAQFAKEIGFHNDIFIAKAPGNPGLLEAVKQWTYSKGGIQSYE